MLDLILGAGSRSDGSGPSRLQRRRGSPEGSSPRRRVGKNLTGALESGVPGLDWIGSLAGKHGWGTCDLPGRSERRFRVRPGLAGVTGGTGLPASCVPAVPVPLWDLFWPKSIYTAHVTYSGHWFGSAASGSGQPLRRGGAANSGEPYNAQQREETRGNRPGVCITPT